MHYALRPGKKCVLQLATECHFRILFLIRSIRFPDEAIDQAFANGFELAGYVFKAEEEEVRPRRIVRVGIVQNKILLPTTAPVIEQKRALLKRIGEMAEVAAKCGVNILCMQEFWSE